MVSAVKSQGHADSVGRSLLFQTDGVVLVLTSGGFRVELAAQQFSSCSSTGTYGCYGWTEGAIVYLRALRACLLPSAPRTCSTSRRDRSHVMVCALVSWCRG